MAVILIKRPYTLYPAFNPNRYLFDSTNKGLSAFRYVVQVYEGNTTTNKILDLRIKPRFLDGYCEVDLCKLLQSKSQTMGLLDSFPNLSKNFYTYSVRVGEEFYSVVNYTNALTNNGGFVQINVTNTLVSGQQVLIKQVDLGDANPLLEGVFNVISATATSFVVSCLFSSISNANIDGSFSISGAPKTVLTNLLPITGMISANANISSDKIESYIDNKYRIGTLQGALWTSLKPNKTYRFRDSSNFVLSYYNWILPQQHKWILEDQNGTTFALPFSTTNVSSQINLRVSDLSTYVNTSSSVPIDLNATESFVIYAIEIVGNTRISAKYQFIYDRYCGVEDYAICFLDRMGSWLTLPFLGRRYDAVAYEKQKGNFVKPIAGGGGSSTIYTDYDRGEKVVESIETRKSKLWSGWMEDAEFDLIRDLVGSKNVFLKKEGNNTFQAINIINSSTDVNDSKNKKLYQKEIEFEFANKDSVNG